MSNLTLSDFDVEPDHIRNTGEQSASLPSEYLFRQAEIPVSSQEIFDTSTHDSLIPPISHQPEIPNQTFGLLTQGVHGTRNELCQLR